MNNRKRAMVPGKILVSAQMGIGNMILFVPFLRALRQGYPNSHIAAVFSERNGADKVLSALAAGVVNEIIQLDLKGVGRLGRLWAGIRLGLRGWDMAIFRFNGFKIEVISAAFVGRAHCRVGHATSPDWNNRWNFILNVPVKMQTSAHEVDRYLQLAEALGLRIAERTPRINVPGEAAQALAAKYSPHLFEQPNRPWLILAPGSSPGQAWKRWPEDLWSELTTMLAGAGIRSVFVGSPGEAPLIDAIIARTNVESMALNTAGRLSLAESAALVQQAPIAVCCDSALMHLSVAVGTRVIGVFGPTDDKRTGPIGSDHLVLRSSDCKGGCYSMQNPGGHLECKTEKCMRGVKVESVLNAVLDIMNISENLQIKN